MKERYLIIEEFELQKSEEVAGLLEQILEDGDLHLTIKWRFCEVRLSRRLIERIAAILYRQGTKREFSVCCIVETGQWKEVCRFRNVLNRYGFEVVLLSSSSLPEKTIKKAGRKMQLEEIRIIEKDYASIRREYERLKGAGIPVSFDESQISSGEYTEWFESWVSDRNACWLLPYQEVTGYLLTGMWTGSCEHDSCLGKYFCLDRDGMLYFCGKKLEGSQIHKISGRSEKLSYGENYDQVLKSAVEKRRRCRAECGTFEICRGGCPLSGCEGEECRDYQERVAYVRSYLQEHSKNYFADIANPVIRQMFLSTVAFGFIPKEDGA